MNTSRALAFPTLLGSMVFGRFAAALAYSITDLGLLNGVPTDATSADDDSAICGDAVPAIGVAKAWIDDNPAARGLARTTAPTQPRHSQ